MLGLFATSANGQSENVLNEINDLLAPAKDAVPALSGVIEGKLSVRASCNKKKFKGLRAVEIEVDNETERAILIDGTESIVRMNGKRLKCAGIKEIDRKISGSRSKLIRTVGGGVASFATIGAVPTISDGVMNSGSVPKRYGNDEARREKEEGLFEKRVIYPKQKTSGRIYFKSKDLKGTKVELPVSDLNNAQDTALLYAPL